MTELLSGAAGGLKLASALFEEAKKVGLLKKFKIAFQKKPRIILLGSTGTGKSNFLHSLSAERPAPIPRELRTIFTKQSTLLVQEKHPYRFVDTPGDAAMKDARIDSIREALSAKGGIAGVINVVAYGYHEYDLGRSTVFAQDGKVKPEFLAKHRQIEIEQLSEWTPLLASPITIDWIITVVTKADLWWDDREAVKRYYQEGDYHKALGVAQSLKPRVLLYSSVFSRFYGEAPLSGYFDEKDRENLKRQLIQGLLDALLQHEV